MADKRNEFMWEVELKQLIWFGHLKLMPKRNCRVGFCRAKTGRPRRSCRDDVDELVRTRKLDEDGCMDRQN